MIALYHWEPNGVFLKPLIALAEKGAPYTSHWFDPTAVEQFAPGFPANTESARQLAREGPLLGVGGEALRDHMKNKARELGLKNVRINAAGCLDRCELGPTVVIYPEGVWYTVPTKEDIDEVLQTHMVEGGRVARLMLKTADKLPADRSK